MSPGRAEAHAEDARSALTRRLARSYLRPGFGRHGRRPWYWASVTWTPGSSPNRSCGSLPGRFHHGLLGAP